MTFVQRIGGNLGGSLLRFAMGVHFCIHNCHLYMSVLKALQFVEASKHGMCLINGPRSIYQNSSMAPRLSGQNCKFFKLLLSLNSQKRLGYKENNTKYRILTRKPRSHVRILIYRTWPIENESSRVSVYSTWFF